MATDNQRFLLDQKQEGIERRARFAVVQVEQLRAVNPLTDDEVVEAQGQVTDDMVQALEEMVNAAKAGQLAGREALALGAVAWAKVSL